MIRQCKGYRVVSLPLSADGNGLHYLYIKEHSDSMGKAINFSDDDNHSSSSGRVLFVGNIDYCCHSLGRDLDEAMLQAIIRQLFQEFGDIDSISISKFHNEDKSSWDEKTRFAHVAFMKKSSIKAALTASDQIYFDIGRQIASKFGLSFYVKSKQDILKAQTPFFDVKTNELKESIAEFMKEYDEKEELRLLEIKRKAEQPDDDGFVLVKPK